VPALIGKNGIEQIVEIELDEAEKAKMTESADAVRKTNGLL
jgi:malate dehydrogenase